ncbi:hypothetical protein [Nocardioides sp. GXQ0305]|uniref:hypothetical protein n=1 Tax=Nocardioides sp. GXQ0305 TaxID=3423912 RepID=UPI003D7DEF72
MTTLLDQPAVRASVGHETAGGLVSLGRCRALDHTFELLVPAEAEMVEVLGHLVGPFLRTSGAARAECARYTVHRPSDADHYLLCHDGERVAAGRTARDVAASLAWHVNRTTIDRSAHRLHLMHASAVTRAGMTVVLPADMESGKTTTAAGLLREGFGYVTDEAVAVDPVDGRVHPFPKRLSLDPGSWSLFPDLASKYDAPRSRQWQIDPADLGAATAQGPVAPPSVIVFPAYVAGARTDLLPISRAEAAYELARMTFRFAEAPGRNLQSAARMVANATVARLRIGDLDEAVAAIEGLVSDRLLEEL